MGTVSYIKHLVSPKCRKFPFDGIIGWKLCHGLPTVEDLQERYAFTYYSTMNKAVTDVNNGSIGANEDAVKDTAVAGVYTDENGGKNVVLLKDHAESAKIAPTADMTINLGGHKLTTADSIAIDLTAGNLTIDGRLNGSGIEKITADTTGILVQSSAGTVLTVKGGTYLVSTNGKSCQAFKLGGKSNISKATITANETTRGGLCLYVLKGGEAEISNCTITVNKTGDGNNALYSVFNYGTINISNCNIRGSAVGNVGNTYGLYNAGVAVAANCDIRVYANYLSGEGTDYYATSSIAVDNVKGGSLTLNDCYVIGTHCGLQNRGILYVNGGTYEGYGHGGFYFAADNTASYVRDALIRDCEMPDGYIATSSRNGAGFYLGGCTNGQVYMDNCKINSINGFQIIAIKNSNNTLYISNSTINNTTGGDANIRIDDGGNMLYIGRGNNFTAEDTNRPGAVIMTDEVYVQGVV